MTTEITVDDVATARAKLEMNRKRYMLEKQRGVLQFRLKPADHNKFKGYHEHYSESCQKNSYIVPDFHTFVVNMIEIGYLAWRDKNVK